MRESDGGRGVGRAGIEVVSDGSELADIAGLPFERALAELEEIVGQLEKGSVSLDESIKIYERGEALKKHCEALLRNAEMRIERITLSQNGAPTGVEPFEME